MTTIEVTFVRRCTCVCDRLRMYANVSTRATMRLASGRRRGAQRTGRAATVSRIPRRPLQALLSKSRFQKTQHWVRRCAAAAGAGRSNAGAWAKRGSQPRRERCRRGGVERSTRRFRQATSRGTGAQTGVRQSQSRCRRDRGGAATGHPAVRAQRCRCHARPQALFHLRPHLRLHVSMRGSAGPRPNQSFAARADAFQPRHQRPAVRRVQRHVRILAAVLLRERTHETALAAAGHGRRDTRAHGRVQRDRARACSTLGTPDTTHGSEQRGSSPRVSTPAAAAAARLRHGEGVGPRERLSLQMRMTVHATFVAVMILANAWREAELE
eukprot:2651705-Pleurochrysis_carterae.AAC.3